MEQEKIRGVVALLAYLVSFRQVPSQVVGRTGVAQFYPSGEVQDDDLSQVRVDNQPLQGRISSSFNLYWNGYTFQVYTSGDRLTELKVDTERYLISSVSKTEVTFSDSQQNYSARIYE
ncbi:MAG: hypothetical protein GF381_04395 [Candidatus Pacebacteria bacterium]|nr:hypothetical protein [Candidatus Paceibacterota bacterium]